MKDEGGRRASDNSSRELYAFCGKAYAIYALTDFTNYNKINRSMMLYL